MLACVLPVIMCLSVTRGVATGWTGVDMSTPLLPEIIPEIDANPVSFHSGEGDGGFTIN